MEPRFENRVELGKEMDQWGQPVPHIDCRFSENDLAMRREMRRSIGEMLERAGGKAQTMLGILDFPGPWRIAARLEAGWKAPPPGSYAHEVGGARMGTDPKTSVVDSHNRCWVMPNVLVTDGACWPTAGWQNPALTIMAVTVRACELAVSSMKAGEL
jgi:choline dehydrogenase-like flavoprotein